MKTTTSTRFIRVALLVALTWTRMLAQNSDCGNPSGAMQQPGDPAPTCFTGQFEANSGPLRQFYTFVATTPNMAVQLTPVVSTSCSFPNTAISYSDFELYNSGDCSTLLATTPNFVNLTVGSLYTFGLTMSPVDQSCVWVAQACPRVVEVTFPLGASLTHWSGFVDRSEVRLNWDVEDPSAVREFRILRCGQSLTPFKRVGLVDGHARGTNGYAWRDIMPIAGHIQYVMEIVDHNGNVRRSEVQEFDVEPSYILQLYPNPCHESLQIAFPGRDDQKYAVSVANFDGIVIDHLRGTPSEINAKLPSLVAQLIPGIYLVQCNDGKHVKSAKFLRM